MAKIHKGIATGSGFAYKGKDLNFSRDVYDNFADLKYDASTYGFPDGFKTVVKDAVTGSDDYCPNTSYNNATFIYKFVSDKDPMLNWHCVAYDNIDEYLWPSGEGEFRLGKIAGITNVTEALKNDKYVWNTNGGYTDLNEYALKESIPSLDGYVTTSALNTTLGDYAKLANADFKALTLNGIAVATTKSLDAYAKLNNSANFSTLTVGNKDVATIESVSDAINDAVSSVLRFKGGVSTNSEIPAADAPSIGDVYVVLSSFRSELFVFNSTSGGATTKIVDLEVGDTLICAVPKVIIGGVSKPAWTIVQANLTNTVSFSSSLTADRLVISDSTSTVRSLGEGSNGQFLTIKNNAPDWGDIPVYDGTRSTGNGLVPYQEDGKNGGFLSIDGTWKIPTDTTYNDVTTSVHGLMTATDKIKLNGIEAGANKYVLHVATDSSLGGIKIGYNELAGEKKYKLQVSSDGKAFVHVPWTDNNTTYTEGTGISISSNTISNSGVISVGPGGTADVILVTTGTSDPTPITINEVKKAYNADNAKSADGAEKAAKLTTTLAGSTIKPVYFEDGIPKPIEYTIETSVPSGAVFTDTTYDVMTGATSSKSGTVGLVPAPAMGKQDLFLKGDGTWAKPTDTLYTLKVATDDALGGIKTGYMSDVTKKKYAVDIENDKAFVQVPWTDTNTTYAIEQSNDNSFTFNSSGDYTKTVTINNVVHATSADNATKVSSALEIENYNPTGELIVASTYNGQNKVTIECITVENINDLFPS